MRVRRNAGADLPRVWEKTWRGMGLCVKALGLTWIAFGTLGAAAPSPDPSPLDVCAPPANGPDYYQFDLVTTKRVPGTAGASGVGEVFFAGTPFGVSVSDDGSYRYDFTVRFQRLEKPRQGTFVVWVTTTTLDRVELAGELTNPAEFSGTVDWNKFLVVVTHEARFDPAATGWEGPVVIRGMSRSGLMHTMAGHGPFEQEKCAAYGYD